MRPSRPVAQKAQASAQPTWELTHTLKRPGRSSGMRTLSMTRSSCVRKASFTKGSSALLTSRSIRRVGTCPALATASRATRRTREFAAKCVETGTKPAVVVNISSIARHGNQGQTNYSAAKAGLVADTKLWAGELARYGIRTGAIAPGFVETPILLNMRPEVLEGMLKAVPLRRAAKPEEIYQAVKFVIECEYFTGRCIDVDGKYANAFASTLLADMATAPTTDNGCTDAENADNDHYYCEPRSDSLKSVFQSAASQLLGGHTKLVTLPGG